MSKAERLHRNFLLLWQGQLVSQVGSQVFGLAGIIWLKHATDSALLAGLLSAAFIVPSLLMAPFGGVLSDRYSRRRVLIACDLVRGTAVAALGLLWFLLPAAHPLSIGGLFLLTLIVGSTTAVFQPAGVAFVPDLVSRESLPRANSIIQTSLQMGGLIAQSLSGVLLRVIGAPLLALFDAGTYFYSAISTALIRTPAPAAAASGASTSAVRPSFVGELRAAMISIQATAGLWGVMIVTAWFRFFIAPITVLFAFYVEGHLHVTADWYGFLIGGMGVGAIGGFVLAGVIKLRPRPNGLTIIGALVLLSAGLAALALARTPWTALALIAVAGAANGYANVKLMTLLQLAIVPEMRGRVFGVFTTVTQALVPVATILAGLTADLTGRNIALVYGCCGLAMMASALVMAINPACRAFLSGSVAVAPPAAVPAPAPAAADAH